MQPPSHPARSRILGIDGCSAGWLVAQRLPDSNALTFQVLDNDGLSAALQGCTLAFVDMPIGLPECESSRSCDRALRAVLSTPRRSSVFNPPVRAVLACDTWEDANATSRRVSGAGLSKQSWFLVPKVRVLDGILSGRRELQARVLESHPEWLFERLAAGTLPPKKSAEGFRRRLELLAPWEPSVEQTVTEFLAISRRNAVLPDDTLDALILLREAETARDFGLLTLPADSSPGPGSYHAALNHTPAE